MSKSASLPYSSSAMGSIDDEFQKRGQALGANEEFGCENTIEFGEHECDRRAVAGAGVDLLVGHAWAASESYLQYHCEVGSRPTVGCGRFRPRSRLRGDGGVLRLERPPLIERRR